MAPTIESITAIEILDSRGWPTLRTCVRLADGTAACASVPSGGSVGGNEAVQLRDGDTARYGGMGVRRAAAGVNEIIAPRLRGIPADRQADIDRTIVELDGSGNKGRLGANAIAGVSMAVARAAASAARVPLYRYLGGASARYLPMPLLNILNGGSQGDNRVDFEDFMIVPVGAPTFREAMRYAVDVFRALGQVLRTRGYATGLGEEGGYAPNLRSNEKACAVIVEAIERAGLRPGDDVALAIDVAAGSFFSNGRYDMNQSDYRVDSKDRMIALLGALIQRYPIVSIEDPLVEHDWTGFRVITEFFGHSVQIVGDDLYATNPRLIAKGIEAGATNAALVRLDQVGTVTEAVDAVHLCRGAGWNFIVAHRSGETEDTFVSDLAVAMGGKQLKAGSVARGERVAKYNRLLEIEAELGSAAAFGNPFGAKRRLVSEASRG